MSNGTQTWDCARCGKRCERPAAAIARREVGVALDALAGGRVEDAVPACARAVEGLCAVFLELAWPACGREMAERERSE